MVRALCLCGLGIVFLMISPPLRGQVVDLLTKGVGTFESYAPYSYVVGVLAVLGTFLVSLKRGARVR